MDPSSVTALVWPMAVNLWVTWWSSRSYPAMALNIAISRIEQKNVFGWSEDSECMLYVDMIVRCWNWLVDKWSLERTCNLTASVPAVSSSVTFAECRHYHHHLSTTFRFLISKKFDKNEYAEVWVSLIDFAIIFHQLCVDLKRGSRDIFCKIPIRPPPIELLEIFVGKWFLPCENIIEPFRCVSYYWYDINEILAFLLHIVWLV